MMGIKINVATNMIPRVKWLETLSQTVRLDPKSVEDGMMNGNIDTPAVPITPTIAKDDAMNANNVLPRLTRNMEIGTMAYTISGNKMDNG